MRHIVIICIFLLIILSACQPASSQPVFTPSAEATSTPIPLPVAAPKVVANLPGVIWSFDISPDNSTIAIATSRGLELYDLKSLAFIKSLDAGPSQCSVSWSPDGKKLAAGIGVALANPTEVAGGEAVLRVWDTATWKVVLETNFAGGMVNERILDIAWKPDGTALALSTDIHGVMVVDATLGKLLSQQTKFASSVMEAAWSPDGSRLVSTSDMAYSLRRWKVDTGEAVRLFDRRVSNPWHVIWMKDGKRIISGHVYGTVCFWTVETNRCDGFIQAHRTAVFSMAVSPDGTRLATGGGIIRVWDTATGKLLTAFGEDNKVIYNHLAWVSPDQTLVSLQTGLDDPEITAVRVWDVSTGVPLLQFQGGKR